MAKSKIGVIMFHGSIGTPSRPTRPSAQTTPRSAVTSGMNMPWSVRKARLVQVANHRERQEEEPGDAQGVATEPIDDGGSASGDDVELRCAFRPEDLLQGRIEAACSTCFFEVVEVDHDRGCLAVVRDEQAGDGAVVLDPGFEGSDLLGVFGTSVASGFTSMVKSVERMSFTWRDISEITLVRLTPGRSSIASVTRLTFSRTSGV